MTADRADGDENAYARRPFADEDAAYSDPDDGRGFEGVGDFDGDPAERYDAHQAAKGNTTT